MSVRFGLFHRSKRLWSCSLQGKFSRRCLYCSIAHALQGQRTCVGCPCRSQWCGVVSAAAAAARSGFFTHDQLPSGRRDRSVSFTLNPIYFEAIFVSHWHEAARLITRPPFLTFRLTKWLNFHPQGWRQIAVSQLAACSAPKTAQSFSVGISDSMTWIYEGRDVIPPNVNVSVCEWIRVPKQDFSVMRRAIVILYQLGGTGECQKQLFSVQEAPLQIRSVDASCPGQPSPIIFLRPHFTPESPCSRFEQNLDTGSAVLLFHRLCLRKFCVGTCLTRWKDSWPQELRMHGK